jgi:hypothetical protein
VPQQIRQPEQRVQSCSVLQSHQDCRHRQLCEHVPSPAGSGTRFGATLDDIGISVKRDRPKDTVNENDFHGRQLQALLGHPGYEDLNDAARLRGGPTFRLICSPSRACVSPSSRRRHSVAENEARHAANVVQTSSTVRRRAVPSNAFSLADGTLGLTRADGGVGFALSATFRFLAL